MRPRRGGHNVPARPPKDTELCEPGEVTTLEDLGVVGLSTSAHADVDGLLVSPDGLRLRDGSTRPTFDWMLRCPGD